LRVADINITVVPDKIGHPNGMQINYEHENQTRNLFIYSDSPQVTRLNVGRLWFSLELLID